MIAGHIETANVTVGTTNVHEEPTDDLLSAVLERSNMLRAYKRVKRNK
ncbi:MAG: hypothetical protein ACJAWL_002237, partial [Motiliproteus sp.]